MSLWESLLSVLKGTHGLSFGVEIPLGTGYTNMRDLIGLFDAVCDVYDRQDLAPKPDGTTFCNFAVDAVAQAMGYKYLAGKTADEIVAFLGSSTDWSEVPFEKAQDMANQGSLLIAGASGEELGQAHGHVCVIRPGKPVYSGHYGGSAPRCLNIGAENFLARAKRGALTNQPCGLNEAFIPLPKIWAWRATL